MDRAASAEPSPWQRRVLQVGDWRITALRDGFFRLDGGAMWGVVPAPLWRPMTPPAEDNTILLALRPFLLERGLDKVVVEVGIGDRWSEKLRQRYRMQRTESLEQTVAAAGVPPGDCTHVVASHCHWDHIGSMVVESSAGELVPLFPNARHFAPAIEVENAARPDHVRAPSYRADDVAPVERAGLLETYEGQAELLPGVRTRVLGGHSDGVSIITVNEDAPGPTAVFWSDVVPTTYHLQPGYIMAYDIDVARSFEQRSRWLERAVEERWIGLFYHDPDEAFGRVVRDGRRYAFEPVESAVLEPTP